MLVQAQLRTQNHEEVIWFRQDDVANPDEWFESVRAEKFDMAIEEGGVWMLFKFGDPQFLVVKAETVTTDAHD